MIDEKTKVLDETKHELLKQIEKLANVMNVIENVKVDLCTIALRCQHVVLHQKESETK